VASLALLAAPSAGAQQPAPGGRHYADRDLWVSPAAVYGGPVYFADETQPLADAVAELLARPELGGYRVIPSKEVRALWSEAQAGRLPGLTARCETPPPPARLARHVYRGASMAEVRVDCPAAPPPSKGRPACVLGVTVLSERPTADDPEHLEETAGFHASLPFAESPARWAERLRGGGLARGAAPAPNGGLGIIGTLGGGKRSKEPPFHLEVMGVEQTGEWREAISAATFKPQAAALESCTRNLPRMRDSWLQPYVIEVDAAGAVGRCEFPYVDHLPPPELSCVCGVLRARGFGAGAPKRRATFSLQVKRRLPPARGGARLVGARATDESATLGDGALDEDALTACLSSIKTDVDEPELPVRFSVGPDGGVKSHATSWPRTIPATARKCMDAVLARSRFSCPLSGASTVDARLQVFVSR
jgi:hypothetical protein